uniref:Uncharacterized protein n=1 Tax=Macrostomum lignano TaxID=282301 RepID=A0A1I8I6Q5_9PLAT
MTGKPDWAAVLDKYPAILSPIDRFLYLYRCPACGPDPTDNCAGDQMRAALNQIDAQIAWYRGGGCPYQRQVHESLLQLRDWLRTRLRPGLPWHDLSQRLADRYAQLDSWSRVCCSAVYAAAWRIMRAGVYADSTAAAMFLLHPNTQHGRYLHSTFLRDFGQLRAAYLSGAVTWEKFALVLQSMDAQVATFSAANAPVEAEVVRRAAHRYKRLLKVFARSFDTDAYYLRTSQTVQQEAELAAKLPRLMPFKNRQALLAEAAAEGEDAEEVEDEDAKSDSPILELRRYLTEQLSAAEGGRHRGWPGHRNRRDGDGDGDGGSSGGGGDGDGDVVQQRRLSESTNEAESRGGGGRRRRPERRLANAEVSEIDAPRAAGPA